LHCHPIGTNLLSFCDWDLVLNSLSYGGVIDLLEFDISTDDLSRIALEKARGSQYNGPAAEATASRATLRKDAIVGM
jgi:hypothetical protein